MTKSSLSENLLEAEFTTANASDSGIIRTVQLAGAQTPLLSVDMNWYILGERERLHSGQFVAVAAAYDDMTATLVRDYLCENGISAAFPPVSYLYAPTPTRIWVHADDEAEALHLLEELRAEWVID